MTNREKYVEEILDIVCNGYRVALKDNNLVSCDDITCDECMLCVEFTGCDGKVFKKWAEQEYIPYVDWSKVAVDTPILVSEGDNPCSWFKRYFAKYENNKVYAWDDGRTSWSAMSKDQITSWGVAKLHMEDDKND